MLRIQSFLMSFFLIIGFISCKPLLIKSKIPLKKVPETTEEIVNNTIETLAEITGQTEAEVRATAPVADLKKVVEALQSVDNAAPAANSAFDPETAAVVKDLTERAKLLDKAIERNKVSTKESSLKAIINNTLHATNTSFYAVKSLAIYIATMEAQQKPENNQKIAKAKVLQKKALELQSSSFGLAQGATNYTKVSSLSNTTLNNVTKKKDEILNLVKEGFTILYSSK